MAANPDPASGKRLDSWKEIAAFLGRAERTVKRWETERGLPVHRVPGGGRSAVFAYAGELAEWLKGKSNELETDDPGPAEPISLPVAPAVDARPEAVPALAPATPPSRSSPNTSNRDMWSPARIAAWLVPLGLTAALILYFSAGSGDSRVKALNDAPRLNLAPDSVAVLPFVNDHADAASDYLSDGITESLIGNLARIPQLKVRSRDSVFRFKGKDIEIRRAGGDLGVSVVVSGRVLQQGDSIEVRAEMTNVRDNTEIWGNRYSGKSADLVKLEEQLAGDIAHELRSTLTPTDKLQVTRLGTQDPEAYALYLKGRYAWNKRTPDDLETAISYFNQAIAKDPEYAQAYAGLADVYSVLHFFGADPRDSFPKSNAAARKALELDPTLAHVHAVLGTNEMEYDWDFAGGEAEFKKAIELDPNDATAHQWYAEKLSLLGRHQEAFAEINRAHELDPLSPVITRVVGGIQATARHYDEGIAVCKQLAQENPTFAIAHDCLFYAYWGKRMYPEAVEEWKAYGRLNGNATNMENAAALERGFHAGGWPRGLTDVIAVYENRRKSGYASPFEIARFYADLGDKDKAFEWLNTAYREHDSLLLGLNTNSQFDSLHSDARYAELVRKIGLPRP